MKIFFVTLCVFAVVVLSRADDTSEDSKTYEECLAENGIKEDEIEKLKDKKDPRLRCIMACVLEKEGVLNKGEIDPDAFKETLASEITELDDKKTSDIVDLCMSHAKEVKEICDKANIMAVCLKDELDKLNIKVRK